MTKSEKIRLLYGAFLALFTLVLGALFIFEAADIYYSGVSSGQIYSREIVGRRLKLLLAPVILYLVAVAAGAVVSYVFPAAAKRPAARDAISVLGRLLKRLPENCEDGELLSRVRRGEKMRLIARGAVSAFAAAAAVMSGYYLFNAAHFPAEDVTGEVLQMLRHVLPWIGSAFAAILAETAFELILSRRELPAVKKLVAGGGAKRVEAPAAKDRGAVLIGCRVALAAAAIVFIVLGAVNGGARDVLIKAINICTECIGLG